MDGDGSTAGEQGQAAQASPVCREGKWQSSSEGGFQGVGSGVRNQPRCCGELPVQRSSDASWWVSLPVSVKPGGALSPAMECVELSFPENTAGRMELGEDLHQVKRGTGRMLPKSRLLAGVGPWVAVMELQPRSQEDLCHTTTLGRPNSHLLIVCASRWETGHWKKILNLFCDYTCNSTQGTNQFSSPPATSWIEDLALRRHFGHPGTLQTHDSSFRPTLLGKNEYKSLFLCTLKFRERESI